MGTRLREETEVRPKPMVEIGGRPILWHIMRWYASHGLSDFILCLGYKGHVIKDYFLNYRARTADVRVKLGSPERIEYLSRHPEENWTVTLLETGNDSQTGARVADAARHVDGPHFCLTYGDGVGDVNIDALLRFHLQHGRLGTVTGVRPHGRFGEIRCDVDGLAAEFNEKPQTSEGVINGGFFVFNTEFVKRYLKPLQDPVLEREPLQRLARDRQLMVYFHDGFWQPMDTYRDMKLLNDMWVAGTRPWEPSS